MRLFILSLALTLPLAACGTDDGTIEDRGDAYEERTDEVGGLVEERGDAYEERTDEVGDDVLYGGYDTDGDGLLSTDEYDAGIGDDNFGTYDADGDGFLNDEEYGVYEGTLEM